MTCWYGGNCASTSFTEKTMPAMLKNALGPLWVMVTGGVWPSFSARASSARRRSSVMALSGMSIVAVAELPVTVASIFERRWPSVETMRTRSPTHSKRPLFTCGRVSSLEMEKWVRAISSESSSTGSWSEGASGAGLGSCGNSLPGMPWSV